MVFNSLPFAIFFPATFIVYWLIGSRHTKLQNSILLLSSYVFYGWWDWRFLSLLIGSSAISYLIARNIAKAESPKTKKIYLYSGVAVSLLLLGFFKYYNFFIENLIRLFSAVHYHPDVHTLKIILPLGISFYTFKILSFLFDVYRERIDPRQGVINYFLYISFFPQLVAGPIERSTHLIPQLKQPRRFDYKQGAEGIKLILWGLFKKIVIADTCAIYVNDIFHNYSIYPASVLLLGTIYFAFQVYADFSGYSDIAIGCGKLFGIETLANFDYPFISKNITEFWRRWHISLSTWFNDYVFTPLYTAIRNWGNAGMYIGIFVTFLLSGLWHGASWHYVFFGILHGGAIVFEAYTKKRRKKISKKMPQWLYDNLSIAITFLFVLITWIYFRADNMVHATNYLKAIFSLSVFEVPGKLAYLPMVALLIIWEFIQRKRKAKNPMDFGKLPLPFRWIIYLVLVFFIFYYYGEEQQFYYFQF